MLKLRADGSLPPALWNFPGAGGDPSKNWTETAGFGPVRPQDLLIIDWSWLAPASVGIPTSNDTIVQIGITCANRANLTDIRTPNSGFETTEFTVREPMYVMQQFEGGRWSCYLAGHMIYVPQHPQNGLKSKVFGCLGEASGTKSVWRSPPHEVSSRSGKDASTGVIDPTSRGTTTNTFVVNSISASMTTSAPTDNPTSTGTTNTGLHSAEAVPSTGFIAGISVGSILLGILGVVLLVWWSRRRGKPRPLIVQEEMRECAENCVEKGGFPVARNKGQILELKEDCILSEMEAGRGYENNHMEP